MCLNNENNNFILQKQLKNNCLKDFLKFKKNFPMYGQMR